MCVCVIVCMCMCVCVCVCVCVCECVCFIVIVRVHVYAVLTIFPSSIQRRFFFAVLFFDCKRFLFLLFAAKAHATPAFDAVDMQFA